MFSGTDTKLTNGTVLLNTGHPHTPFAALLWSVSALTQTTVDHQWHLYNCEYHTFPVAAGVDCVTTHVNNYIKQCFMAIIQVFC